MNCEFVRKNLIDIIEGKLPADTQKEVEAHLESCSRCTGLARRFAQVWQVWQDPMPVKPSPAFWLQLQRRIRDAEQSKFDILSFPLGWRRWLRPVAVAATLVIAVLIGHHLGNFPVDNGTDWLRLQTGQEVQQRSSLSLGLFDYYLSGLDDFPTGSVGEFYVNPGEDS